MDLSLITGNLGLLAGGGTAGMVLWVLKKVPNEHICSVVETTFVIDAKSKIFPENCQIPSF